VLSAILLAMVACTSAGSSAANERSTVSGIEDSMFATRADSAGPFPHVGAVERDVNGDLLAFVDGARVIRTSATGSILASATRVGGGPGEWRYVLWAGADSSGAAVIDVATLLPGTDVFIDPAEQMFVRVPGGRVDWAAARDSIIVAGNGGDDSVLVQVGQSPSRWVRLQLPPIAARMTPARAQEFIEAELSLVHDAEDRKRMRRTFAKVDVPRNVPRFERLLLDDRGRIWSAVASDSGRRIWRAFDLNGTAVAQVGIPEGARPWLMSNGAVVATIGDDDGLQRLVRYTFPE